MLVTADEEERLGDDWQKKHYVQHSDERGGSTDHGGETKVGREQAEVFYFNAITALIKHRKTAMTAVQDAPDPGEEWMKQHGDSMVSVVQWMKLAYPSMPDRDRMQRLEESIREVEHMGKPAPHCNHTVVDAHMAELPDELKETLKRCLRNGIFTGIEWPKETTSAEASMTATQHAPAVWKQMQKFVQHGWVRAFPAELRETISTWALLVSPTHYVADQDRLVADLSNATSLGEGNDPNSLS